MGPPKIDPIVISNIQATTVRLSMKITSAEGGRIVRYGFAISSTIRSPLFSQEGSEVRLYENSLTRNMLSILSRDPSSGSGTFEVDVKDLKAGTTYYVTGYAINENEEKINKTTHTAGQQFTTKGPPSVENFNSSNPSYTSFVAFARVLGDGGSNVFERGFYVGTNPTPWINGEKRSSGSGVGDFQLRIDGRTPDRTYYYAAYAINEFGETIDRRVVTVKTLANTKPVINNPPSLGVFIGKGIPVSAIIDSDGGRPILERGFYYSTNPNSFTLKESSRSDQGFPQGAYSNTISRDIVFGGVQYFVWAFARNDVGETIGQVRSTFTTPNKTTPIVRNVSVVPGSRSATLNGIIDSDGFGTIRYRGFRWANNQSMLGTTPISGTGDPTFSVTISGLSPNTNYWFQSFAENEIGLSSLPAAQPSLPAAQQFTTLCDLPKISLGSPAPSRSTTSLSFTYNVTDLGGSPSVTRGVCVSSSNRDPMLNGPNLLLTTAAAQSTTGTFSVTIPGLTRLRTYYVQGYVTSTCQGTTTTVYSGPTTISTL
jgi:hypothetical protein